MRSEAARRAILGATARLFALRGYEHLTIEGVAAEAGVGKQTIYRWWPSKGALVAECLLEGLLLPERLGPRDTGDVRSDLIAWLEEIDELIEQPLGATLFRSLVAAAAENVDVARRLYGSLGATSSLTGRLEAAMAAGELRSDTPMQEIGEALTGATVVRALGRVPATPGSSRRLVNAVIGSVSTDA
ncbi:TetR/AcrR family transcriptional regulator [uncultured Microbacterium sp.]|uniref:TetR/AcrR family transcriptional regulator n=1 Tax=uncultured Microbacterium sp. TaxID=191216 RepID=UPI0035CA7CEB